MAEQPLLPFEEPAPRERPEAPENTSRLIAELDRVSEAAPLEEKILVSPSLMVGHTLVERLAREGHAWMNLRVETPRTLALEAVSDALAREGRRLVSRAQALALIEHACEGVLGEKSYFGELRRRPGFHRAMQRTLEEVRAAGIAPSRIPIAAFADPRKARELRRILESYMRSLEEGGYVDDLEVLARAARAARPSGDGTRYLVPGDAELSVLERRLLERLAADRLETIAVDAPASWTARGRHAGLFRAIGEENEIREAFRRVLEAGTPFDEVEILHTDESVYPPLLWELSREQGIPCTFAGGVAVTYSRPGQAATAFLSWIAEGYAAERLREALASGMLMLQSLGGDGSAPPPRAAARALREARVGWGRRRHVVALQRLIRSLEEPERPSRRDDRREETPPEERAAARVRRLAAARLAAAFVSRCLELAPAEDAKDALGALARGTLAFVLEFARVIDDLDAAARDALKTLFREIAELPPAAVPLPEALSRLRDAVGELAVVADRPRPGRIHVGHFASGGYSGRRHPFLLGLDETRHPGTDLEDPVLLDDERRRINEALEKPLLAMERERPRDHALALQACVARLRGSLVASYSKFDIRNLSQAGEPAPSPFFLDLFRCATGRPDADYRQMLAELPEACGFVPAAGAALDETEWWLAEIRRIGPSRGGCAVSLVRNAYPWLADGLAAEEARAGDAFTLWDGRLAGPAPELDPRRSGRPMSASRIQDLAHCPFAFFVRHVLRVEPPDDLERDPTRWLEPRDEGSLLHEVFRTFLERVTGRGEKPDAGKHRDELLGIATAHIDAWRERVPPSSLVAFEAQREAILQACRTFLASETEHCRRAAPRWFEVSFGLRDVSPDGVASAEPVEIALPGGRRLRLRGSIDRVDEGEDGLFQVWDYKTGSAAGIHEGRGLHGGRQAQPSLYALALEELLRRRGTPGKVARSGYFFPGRKGEGQRIAIPVDPGETGRALSRLFDLAEAGFFPHTPSREGCRFCAVESVCGGSAVSSAAAERKLGASNDPILTAFRQLHGCEDD